LPFLRGVGSVALAWAALQLSSGCGQTVEVGVDDALTSGGTGGGGVPAAGSAGASEGGGARPCEVTPCRGKQYDCGNCEDDDQDGQIDALDSDCLGPCDDDESALRTGLVLIETGACKQDCYFDGDNGAGNDKCEWSHRCDELSVAPNYPPSGDARCEYDPTGMPMGVNCAALAAEQLPQCTEECLPVVPNGCDCFGCCEVPGRSGEFHFIGLMSATAACTLDTVEDAEACPPCSPVRSCMNECDDCEVCVGRPKPAGCDPGNGCPPGQAACDMSNEPCDYGEYCVTGCCVRAPEPT
jgi:hypothetical protein